MDGLMMREWPYTSSNRDELGCTSPALEMPLRLPPQDISRGLGKPLGRQGCTTQYIPPLSSVLIQSFQCRLLTHHFFHCCICIWCMCTYSVTETSPCYCRRRMLPLTPPPLHSHSLTLFSLYSPLSLDSHSLTLFSLYSPLSLHSNSLSPGPTPLSLYSPPLHSHSLSSPFILLSP